MSASPTVRESTSRELDQADLVELSLQGVRLPFIFRPAVPLTDNELLAFCAANDGLEVECDADGAIRVMVPASPGASQLNIRLTSELDFWAERDGRGVVFGPDLGVRFPDQTMRGPDAAWLSRARWESLDRDARRMFLPFCPEFVAELRSPSDRASQIEAKMEFWMERGAALGWLIDPTRKLAMIYRPSREPETLLEPAVLEGEGPIAGFRLDMRRFWQ